MTSQPEITAQTKQVVREIVQAQLDELNAQFDELKAQVAQAQTNASVQERSRLEELHSGHEQK